MTNTWILVGMVLSTSLVVPNALAGPCDDFAKVAIGKYSCHSTIRTNDFTLTLTQNADGFFFDSKPGNKQFFEAQGQSKRSNDSVSETTSVGSCSYHFQEGSNPETFSRFMSERIMLIRNPNEPEVTTFSNLEFRLSESNPNNPARLTYTSRAYNMINRRGEFSEYMDRWICSRL